MNRFSWLIAMMRLNVRAAFADGLRFFLLAGFMAVNNVMWFAVFGLFFHVTGAVGGWTLADAAVLFGVGAFSFGVGFTLCGGAWRMAQPLADGTLDIHLGRPRPVLLGVMFSRIESTAIGDIIAGIIIIFCFGHLGLAQKFGALGLGLLASSIFVASSIAISSLVFWTGGRSGLADQLIETLIGFSTMPLHGLPLPVRVLLFTVLPAGFVAFLPADIVRHFTWEKVAAMAGAAVIFPVLAGFIFHRGLRRYTSGNRMVAGL